MQARVKNLHLGKTLKIELKLKLFDVALFCALRYRLSIIC